MTYDKTDSKLYVAYLKPAKGAKAPPLVVLNGIVQNEDKEGLEAWAQAAMDSVYDGGCILLAEEQLRLN